MPLTFEAAPFNTVRDGADRLGRAHWRELYGEAPYPANLDGIAEMQASGAFAYFVARTTGGEVVGHVGFFVFQSPVHGEKIALDAFYYVDPQHRKHGTARKLLKAAGEILTASGTPVVIVSCLNGSGLGQMIQDAGYQKASTAYSFVGA